MNTWNDSFPLLANKPELTYLDNAATTQKPSSVVMALQDYYSTVNANVHRGVHELSDIATNLFEESREAVASLINAPTPQEVIWTRGTTECINLVAHIYSSRLQEGDEVLITEMEHHSNIVPWQLACSRSGALIKAVRVLPNGELDLEHYESLLSDRTKVVALAHVSNALGTVNPVRELIQQAHAVGAVVLLDGAQAMSHIAVDVQALDCDFYAFSGHKMFGPTGIGALYARRALVEDAPPWQGGGEMIEEVQITSSIYQKLPFRFEAGTPNIAGSVALRAAVDFINQLDRSKVAKHELDLLNYTNSCLQQIEGVQLVGEAKEKVPIVSFNLDGAHSSDVGTLLNNQHVAVRTGHHCAMPLMKSLGITGTVRASLALYNSREDIDKLTVALDKARRLLLD